MSVFLFVRLSEANFHHSVPTFLCEIHNARHLPRLGTRSHNRNQDNNDAEPRSFLISPSERSATESHGSSGFSTCIPTALSA